MAGTHILNKEVVTILYNLRMAPGHAAIAQHQRIVRLATHCKGKWCYGNTNVVARGLLNFDKRWKAAHPFLLLRTVGLDFTEPAVTCSTSLARNTWQWEQ